MVSSRLHAALISSLTLLAFATTGAFASTDSITLRLCIETALKHNPQLLVSKGIIESSTAGYQSAKSALLPQLSIASGAGRGGIDSVINNGRYTAGLSAQMQLFDFGKTYSRIAGSERSLRASESDAQSVRQKILLDVCSAYYNCLAARAVKDVSLEALNLAETRHSQAIILLEAGRGVKFNVVRAEVDVENNRLAAIRAENGVRTCRLTLANALGGPLADTLVFHDNLAETINLPFLETAITTALANRPEIKAAQLRCEAAQKSVTSAECTRYPAITSSAGVGVQSPTTTINWHETWNVGIALSLPLYQGGAISAAVRQAKGSLMSAEGNLAIAKQNVSLDVEQQYQSVQVAMTTISVAKKVVESASAALTIAQERFKVGSGSPLEISDAELVFSNSKIAFVQALTDLNSANARLQRAMGTLGENVAR